MKPCAFSNQTLIGHSKGAVNKVEKIFNNQYFIVASKRLSKVYDIDWKQLKKLTIFLTAFHDMEKAAEYYQRQFDDECKPIGKTTTFIYHEIGGSVFLFKNNWNNEIIKFWSVLTIMNHLNAIRGIHTISGVNLRKEMLYLKKYGEALINEFDRDMEGIIDGKLNVNDYEMRDFQLMVEWLKAFSMKKNIAKGYIFLLAPLIVGDNLDSNEQRSVDEGSKAKSRFIKSLEEMENES